VEHKSGFEKLSLNKKVLDKKKYIMYYCTTIHLLKVKSLFSTSNKNTFRKGLER